MNEIMVKISIMELEKKTIREENYREKFSHYQIMEVPTQIGWKRTLTLVERWKIAWTKPQ